MQITSNSTPNILDNFDSPSNNPTNSVNNKQTSSSQNSITQSSETEKPVESSGKYQQYSSLESNYFKSLLNASLPNNTSQTAQTTNQTATNIKPGDSSINKTDNQPQPASTKASDAKADIKPADTKAETTKVTNEPSKAAKDDLQTEWRDKQGHKVRSDQNKYNDLIKKTANDPQSAFPEIGERELKSLIFQESKFDPKVINGSDHAGLAQLDKPTAKEVGLKFDEGDPRLDPKKVIPVVPEVLSRKYRSLEVNDKYNKGLKYYNQDKPLAPEEKLKFALAAYNGGETNVKRAINRAYNGKIPPSGVKFDDVHPFLSKGENRNFAPEILERANQK